MTTLSSGWNLQQGLWSLNFVLDSTSTFVLVADSTKTGEAYEAAL